MTRGRKKDLTITPSRSLTQQRDYRARKAQYISDLEERVRIAESENKRLEQELNKLRGSIPWNSGLRPDMYAASADLARNLTAASQALNRFKEVAFGDPAYDAKEQESTSLKRATFPTSIPSPTPSPPWTSSRELPQHAPEQHADTGSRACSCYSSSPRPSPSPSIQSVLSSNPRSRYSLSSILCDAPSAGFTSNARSETPPDRNTEDPDNYPMSEEDVH